MSQGPSILCAKCKTKPHISMGKHGTVAHGPHEGQSIFVRVMAKCHGAIAFENGSTILSVLQSGNDFVMFGDEET